MAQRDVYTSSVKQEVEQRAREAVDRPWFAYLARLGYAAKGIVYLLAGVLSGQAALGLRNDTASKAEALKAIFAAPFGRVALVLIAAGLCGYVLLRLVQALLDPERKGSGAKGLAIRAGYAISGLLYVGLAISALRLAFDGNDGPDNGEQGLVAQVFAVPLGRWLVGAVGLVVIGVGLWQIYRGLAANFSEHFRWGRMSRAAQAWTTWLGRAGLAARGIVFGLIGGFMVQAAALLDAGKAHGSDDALQWLAGPLGWWAVGVVAAGLAAYGVYMLAAAWYGRIVTR
jgi:hypothetical protein